jgi:hypothetical protein
MKRRKFLKILGTTSIVVAAGGGTAGYFLSEPGVDYPDEPWHTAGSLYQEPRMRALSYAILAPNPHNRQPWLVRLDGRMGITLYCQLDRRLPETDPYDRQIMIGLGCFGELLRIAAAEDGFDARIEWFPAGMPDGKRLNDLPIAQIEFIKGSTPDPLFKQVLNRRSTKEPFDTSRQVDDATLADLKGNDPNIQTTKDTQLVAKLRGLTMDAFMVEIETARTYKESIDLMRIGNKAVAANPDGIDLGGGLFSIMKNLGFITPEKLADPNSQAYKQGIPPFRDIMYSSMAYSWITSSGNTRMDQVKVGIKYLISNLKAAELGLSMHPISQALQEYPEMEALYQELHELITIKSPGRIQMLARLGYGPQVVFSPRWPLKTRMKS